MARYNDPTEVQGCECVRCLNWQSDNELDVNDAGICWECVDQIDDEDDPESPREPFFDIAADIVGARW